MALGWRRFCRNDMWASPDEPPDRVRRMVCHSQSYITSICLSGMRRQHGGLSCDLLRINTTTKKAIRATLGRARFLSVQHVRGNKPYCRPTGEGNATERGLSACEIGLGRAVCLCDGTRHAGAKKINIKIAHRRHLGAGAVPKSCATARVRRPI